MSDPSLKKNDDQLFHILPTMIWNIIISPAQAKKLCLNYFYKVTKKQNNFVFQ